MTCSSRAQISPRLALPLLLAVLGACGPDKGPGSLDVSYTLGNNKTCTEVGVNNLSATLTPAEEDSELAELSEDDVGCARDGVIAFDEVPAGIYNLEVIAYDDSGVAIFDNLGQATSERRVEVFEAAPADNEAELTSRPAIFGVAWALGNNGLSNCDGVGIDNFEITAYQAGGGTVLLETVLDCELTGNAEGYRIIDDPERSLNGTLFGEVGIQAHAADGSNVGAPVAFEFEPVGPGYPVELAIECTDVGCEPI